MSTAAASQAANHLPEARQDQHGPFHTWDLSCQSVSDVYNTHDVRVTPSDVTCVIVMERTGAELHATS